MLITLDKKNKFEQVITAKDKPPEKPCKEMFNLTSDLSTAQQSKILFLTLSDWQKERPKLPSVGNNAGEKQRHAPRLEADPAPLSCGAVCWQPSARSCSGPGVGKSAFWTPSYRNAPTRGKGHMQGDLHCNCIFKSKTF